jgi:hypothetical protein
MSIYTCNECNDAAFQALSRQMDKQFHMTLEEVAYLVANIQHEYLNKETYYFASDLFGRMERFLKDHQHELAGRDSKTT